MSSSSHIQWTEATWNPVAGCRKVSPGCDHCYAMRDAHRMAGNPNATVAAAYAGLTQIQNGRVNWTGVVRELPERLNQPLHWRKPKRIFVNSLSDLFHEDVSDAFIGRVWDVMEQTPRHTYQVLTKRPERMLDWVCDRVSRGHTAAPRVLANVWLGTSVEDQARAWERVPALEFTPAAVRFISAEPLLGALDLSHWLRSGRLHWVIAGGESGTGARACAMPWLRSLARQCHEHGVALFVKQLGSQWAAEGVHRHPKGGDPGEWPLSLQVREYPAEASR